MGWGTESVVSVAILASVRSHGTHCCLCSVGRQLCYFCQQSQVASHQLLLSMTKAQHLFCKTDCFSLVLSPMGLADTGKANGCQQILQVFHIYPLVPLAKVPLIVFLQIKLTLTTIVVSRNITFVVGCGLLYLPWIFCL